MASGARVVVVGGGFGGCAVAARLAKLGHTVTLLERLDRVGGAVGQVEQDGFAWDTGPTATALPAVLRDLFRKSGRPLERELELVPVTPMREHRFEDGTRLPMPSGSRAEQLDAVSDALGEKAGWAWVAYVGSFAPAWDALRRGLLETPWSPEHASPELRALLRSRGSLHRAVRRAFRDERLRAVARSHAVLDGHDPRDVPAWLGVLDYVEQNFGTWTVPGGLGRLAPALQQRLEQRRVEVRLGTTVRDVLLTDGRAAGVATDHGDVPADLVVCAVDPRSLPALEPSARRTNPALPPTVCHLGLDGDVPDLPAEVVLHGDPSLIVRTGGRAPEGMAAWTVLGRGRLAEDVLVALARRGLDVRDRVRTRVDRSPREQVLAWGGSPYGVRWQGPRTVARRLEAAAPVPGVLGVGAHVAAHTGLPFVGLTAAVAAEQVGRASRS